ncbi:MAG: alpha/beta hydrolase, partial [Pseudonocardiaceae bacterium]
MVLTYGDVRSWNADAVDETGNTVRQRKETLLGLEDDLAATAVAWSWSGDAATAARQELRKLNDRAEHLVAEASSVQRALYDASDGVRNLQHAVKDADAKAAANQYTIT